jgi:hypothetical protein
MSVSQPQNATVCHPYPLSSRAILLKWDKESARIHPSAILVIWIATYCLFLAWSFWPAVQQPTSCVSDTCAPEATSILGALTWKELPRLAKL